MRRPSAWVVALLLLGIFGFLSLVTHEPKVITPTVSKQTNPPPVETHCRTEQTAGGQSVILHCQRVLQASDIIYLRFKVEKTSGTWVTTELEVNFLEKYRGLFSKNGSMIWFCKRPNVREMVIDSEEHRKLTGLFAQGDTLVTAKTDYARGGDSDPSKLEADFFAGSWWVPEWWNFSYFIHLDPTNLHSLPLAKASPLTPRLFFIYVCY